MNTENINCFLLFNDQIIRKKQIVTRILLIWGFTVAIWMFYSNNTFLILTVLNIPFTIFSISIMKRKSKKEYYRNVFMGLHSIYSSVMLVLISYGMCVIQTQNKPVLLLTMFLLLVLFVSLLIIIINRNIKKGVYCQNQSADKTIAKYSLIGSFIGVFISRLVMPHLSQNMISILVSLILLFLAYLNSSGCSYLYKAYLEKKLGSLADRGLE